MTAQDVEHPAVRRGRAARQTERLARSMESLPYLTRKLAPVEVIYSYLARMYGIISDNPHYM